MRSRERRAQRASCAVGLVVCTEFCTEGQKRPAGCTVTHTNPCSNFRSQCAKSYCFLSSFGVVEVRFILRIRTISFLLVSIFCSPFSTHLWVHVGSQSSSMTNARFLQQGSVGRSLLVEFGSAEYVAKILVLTAFSYEASSTSCSIVLIYCGNSWHYHTGS